MVKVAITDVPDHKRKQHQTAHPTAGGIGILVGFLTAFGGVPLFLNESQNFYVWAWLGLVLFAGLLGLIDDMIGMSPRLKLTALAMLAAIIALQTTPTNFVFMSFQFALPFWFGFVGAVLWLLVIVNAVNFMDGSNGLAMGNCAIALFFSTIIAYQGHFSPDTFGILREVVNDPRMLMVVALCGFLPWNVIFKRIFSGDTGALSVGLFLGIVILGEVENRPKSLFSHVLCVLPMLVDVILTVAWRIKYCQKLTQGHRHHAYQILLRSGWSHTKVALLYWAMTGTCGLIGWLSTMNDDNSTNSLSVVAFASCLAVLCGFYALVRRYAYTYNFNDA